MATCSAKGAHKSLIDRHRCGEARFLRYEAYVASHLVILKKRPERCEPESRVGSSLPRSDSSSARSAIELKGRQTAMLQRIAVEPGHRGPTVAITTRRVQPFRQQPYALLIEAFATASERRRDARRRRKDGSAGSLEHAIALVHILCNEAGITDDVTLVAAVLQDTLADTQLRYMDLRRQFGPLVADTVVELTDESSGFLKDRPPLRLHAVGSPSHRAKLITLAQQIAALREMTREPDLPEESAQTFAALRAEVEEMRGTHATLECLFDEESARVAADMNALAS